MTLLHDAMTAYLAGLTTKRTEKEIWWENERGDKLTVELVSVRWGKHIIRSYYENGNLNEEYNYFKNQRHGLCRCYYENSILHWETNYRKGTLHGTYKDYYKDGSLRQSGNYYNGNEHGLIVIYNENGKRIYKAKYKHGIRQ